jgi:MoxR-like ATPase
VILIDEVNMAHPRVTAAFHQLLAVTRRISLPETGKTVKAGAGGDGEVQPVLIAAAYNPHYQGVMRLNEALTNRFALPLDWGYERNVEEQLVYSKTLLDFADNVRSLSDVRSPLSTNALMEFERHLQGLNFEAASKFLCNRFSSEERSPVSRALNAHAVNIVNDLGMSGDDLAAASAREELENMSNGNEEDEAD